MIISTGRKYVFVHIPKTGGTAMALALEDRAMKDDMMLGDTPKAKKRRRRLKDARTRGRLWKHSTLADIDGLLPEGVLEGLFAFTLVRNPWDRMVSYYHWLRGQGFDHPAVRLASELDFPAFVTHAHTRAGMRNAPAARYMRRADGTEQCAAYIRIEAYAQDVAPLAAHLGFQPVLQAGVNPSGRDRDYRPYYDDDAAQAVSQDCREDIDRFGYHFDA